ncbi:MAG: ribonucleoside-diphosphate reductase, adenosylcobalamin-dependent, partial [Rhodobacteraceae bacterium GWE1_64_9]
TIRPRGAEVKGVAADASGPLSFMDVWDAMCRTIMSAGSRRGAMMATMRCDHPDVEAFIEAKKDPARLRMFNLSVLITDPFMDAVKADAAWDLQFGGRIYKTVQARDLWNRIMRNTYDFAEPGVIFIDRINRMNNLAYCETIAATNPCGEQPLPPYGACLLGSINLATLVSDPFTPQAQMNPAALDDLVRLAVRMMDNVVDASRFPLPEQEAEARNKRRIGLGVTGLADALLMLGLRYGSEAAAVQTEAWMKAIARASYLASVDLAKEKGPFPLFDAEGYLASGNMLQMDEDVRAAIRTHGIRNALLTSIAPTGTISLYAGNVSSGIEPVFAYAYKRKVLQKDGSRTEEEVVDYAVKMWRDLKGDTALPDYFVNAQTLPPLDHVRMQAAAQKWIDSSISKTINCPEDISFEAFKEVYMAAWDQGCKGCTTYRPNAVTGSVLTVSESSEKTPAEAPQTAQEGEVVYLSEPLDRPAALEGQTYKVKWPGSEHALYITINDIVIAGHRRPFEVFINSKNMEHFAWTVALTRMISAVFRRGGDVSFVVEELKAVFDPRGGAWMDGRYIPSILAAIGGVIERHLVSIGFIEGEGMGLKSDPKAEVIAVGSRPGKSCDSCGSYDLRMVEGCMTCGSCGQSKCG